MKEGIIVVNKPEGMTSHDVVDFVRRRLKIRRVGHAGTLDPIATGVLLILVGRCTKLFNHFLYFDKEYLATLTLGKRTTSGDCEGKIIENIDGGDLGTELDRVEQDGLLADQDDVSQMQIAVAAAHIALATAIFQQRSDPLEFLE